MLEQDPREIHLSVDNFSNLSPEMQRDRERRVRREIANSNERRRMQSINSGFQALKMLIPHGDGEKLSKAAILQQTAEYIFTLEEDKTKLLQQNTALKRLLDASDSFEDRKVHDKRIKLNTDYESLKRRREEGQEKCSREQSCVGDLEPTQKELIELRLQLERERKLRLTLEDQKKKLETQNQQNGKQNIFNSVKNLSSSTSVNKQHSLDTIVQAIYHLEGENLDL